MADTLTLYLIILNSVPRYLLEDVAHGGADPFRISDYTHGKIWNNQTNKMALERFLDKFHCKSFSVINMFHVY